MKEILTTIGGILVILGIVFGTYQYLENRYALAEELKTTQKRLEYKIVADQLQSVQERLWKILDRCGSKQPEPTTKEEIRQLESQKDMLKQKLIEMEKGQKK